MIGRGLLLSTLWIPLTWCVTVQTAAAQAPPARADGARDPWGAMALADRLESQDERRDEFLALLLSALDDNRTRTEAAARLERLFRRTPPRNAWYSAYDRLLATGQVSDGRTLRIRAAQAGLQHRSTRRDALNRLNKMLAANPDDGDIRLALGDGHLRGGELDKALAVFRGGRSHSRAWRGEIAALIALGRYDEAMRIGPELVPAACKATEAPIPCALGLVQMDYPEAATASLERARRAGGPSARTRTERAALFATQARLEDARNHPTVSVALWAGAVSLEPRDRSYRTGYIQALLATGQAGRAKAQVESSTDPLLRTIEAVRLATSVALNSRDPENEDILNRARALDGAHPVVIRAWSHHLIVAGRAAEAMRVLDPYMQERAREMSWLDLYTWAAWTAGRSDKAVDTIRKGVSRADSAMDWQRMAIDMARFHAIAAEADKKAGNLDSAIERYRLAHALDPSTVSHMVGIGGALWAAGHLDAAERAYRAAWKSAPGNRQALLSMVGLLRSLGREAEARALLAHSGYTDVAARQLERELEMMEVSRDARLAREAGQYEDARQLYEQLLIIYPNESVLLKELADTLSGMGEFQAAADVYARARDLRPGDTWLALGEAQARVALGQPDRARYILDQLPPPQDADLKKAYHRARNGVRRAEADELADQGKVQAAYTVMRQSLDADPDPVIYSGLAGLYMRTWQFNAAQAYYEEALTVDPGFDEAERGIILALAAKGQYAKAQQRAGVLVARDPIKPNVELAAVVERQRSINDAAAASVAGRIDASRRILTDQLDAYPGDKALRVALAALLLREGKPEEAYETAKMVLAEDPAHPGALAALQAAGLELRRSKEVLELYKAARAHDEKAGWLDAEIRAMELAVLLDDARDAATADAGAGIVDEATQVYGDNTARHWVMIGSAWLDLGQHTKALEAFETARSLDPSDPGAALGLAGALSSRNQIAEAEQVLANHWQEHGSVETGVALARTQASRGRPMAAKRTLDEVRAAAKEAPARAAAPRPPTLEVQDLPSGRRIAPDDQRHPPEPSATFPDVDVGVVEKKVDNPYRFSATAGVGTAARPGAAGEQYLQSQFAPIGAEVVLYGPLRLQAEIIPVRIYDGANDVRGATGSAALSTPLGAGLSGVARVGSSARGATVPTDPYVTWHGAISGRLAGQFDADIETGRAPVTDTLTSWVGATDTDTGLTYGRVHDTWVGAKLGRYWSNGATAGLLGRWGEAEGLLMATDATQAGVVPWHQALAWVRYPLREQKHAALWLGVEGMLLDHDRQVDGFGAGAGAMFSPDVFTSGMARFEALWGDGQDSGWSACGVVGAGPLQIQGAPTLYLNPGVYLGYTLQGSLRYALADDWSVIGHATHQGSWVVWGQTTALVQLRYGQAASSLRTPSPAFSSPIHGPPVAAPKNCGVDWSEGQQ